MAVVNVFGKRGAGKTTLIRGNLKYFHGPVVIIDILGNYSAEELKKKAKLNAFETDDISEAINWIEEYLEKSPKEQQKQKIITLQAVNPGLAVDYISAALWEAHQGTLVLDEADAFEFSEAPCYDQIIRYGRNRDVHVVTGVRRPAELHKNITAAANSMYAFGTHEPRDIEYFEKTIFGERAQALISMPKYSGIFVDYDKGTQGKFRMDIDGNLFQTEVVSINQK